MEPTICFTEQEYLQLQERIREIDDRLKRFVTYMYSCHAQVPLIHVIQAQWSVETCKLILAIKQVQVTETPPDAINVQIE